MPKSKDSKRQVSADPSLEPEDDEHDEDFIASEVEGSAYESSDAGSDYLGTSSDEDDDDDGPSVDDDPELAEAVRRALLDDSVVLHEEEILSDSEFSRQFPDEEEDEDEEVMNLLGDDFAGDTSGLVGSASVTVTEHSQDEGVAGRQPETQPTTDKAKLKDSNNNQNNAKSSIVKASKHDGTHRGSSQRKRARFAAIPVTSEVGSYLPEDEEEGRDEYEQAAAEGQAPSASGAGNPAGIIATTTAGGGGSSLAITGDQPSSRFPASSALIETPIAQRTRAQVNLGDVEIEALELDNGEEQLLLYGVDDQAEYRRFLENLQLSFDPDVEPAAGGGGLGAGYSQGEEDSEDEDFIKELQRQLLGEELADKDGFPLQGGERVNKHGKTYRKGPVPRQYRKPIKPNPEQRPLFLAKLRSKNAHTIHKAEIPQVGPMAPQLPPTTVMPTAAREAFTSDLDILANAALYMTGTVPQEVPGEAQALTNQQQQIIPNAAVPALAMALPPPPPPPVLPPVPAADAADPAAEVVVWRPPLPAALRKKQAKAEAARAATNTTHGPIVDNDGQQQQQQPGNPLMQVFNSGDYTCAQFHSGQCRELHRQLHQHLQLLTQVHVMSVSTGPSGVAAGTRKLLDDFVQMAEMSLTVLPQINPFACYPRGILGRTRDVNDTENPELQAYYWEPSVDRAVTSILDVGPLKHVGEILSLTRDMAPPDENAIQTQISHWREKQKQQGSGGGEENEGNAATAAGGEGADGGEDGDLNGEGPAKKKRRRGRLPGAHELWEQVPPEVLAATQLLTSECDPGLLPKVPSFLPTLQMIFTPAEDALLAWGIRQYLYDWARIKKELLPGKTEKQLFNRKKNRTTSSAPDNPIKQAVTRITRPLSPDEIELLTQAVEYYGKQSKRWEVICRDHLPHRQPQVLATLWAEHQGGGTKNKGASGKKAKKTNKTKQGSDDAQQQNGAAGGDDGQEQQQQQQQVVPEEEFLSASEGDSEVNQR